MNGGGFYGVNDVFMVVYSPVVDFPAEVNFPARCMTVLIAVCFFRVNK